MFRNRNEMLKAVAGAALSIGFASAAKAAVVNTLTTDVAPAGGAANTPYVPTTLAASATDLATGLTPTVAYTGPGTGSTTFESSGGPARWNDGSLASIYATPGPDGNAADHAAYGTVTGIVSGTAITQTLVTYNLGSSFNLSSVDVYSGWNDSGRDKFTFSLQTSSDNVTYTTLSTFNKGADNTGAITVPVTSRVRFTDDGGLSLATAQYVRILVTDADNGTAGMVEFDIFGTPVPEPTSLGALGLGGLLALRRRSR